MTFRTSPETTVRLPPVKLPAENKIPAVPVLTVAINAPATVFDAVIENEVDVDDLEPPDAADQLTVGLLPLYAVPAANSVQPA